MGWPAGGRNGRPGLSAARPALQGGLGGLEDVSAPPAGGTLKSLGPGSPQ